MSETLYCLRTGSRALISFLSDLRPLMFRLLLFSRSVIRAQPRPVGLLIEELFHTGFAPLFWIAEAQRIAFRAHIVFGLRVIHVTAIFVDFFGGSKHLRIFLHQLLSQFHRFL